MLKFNMGCGHRRAAGFVNVDAYETCGPDEVWNLEQTPWPWPDNCADEVHFVHSLEHMGQTPTVFLAIMQELYRICADQAKIRIVVPHPRSDDFLDDPTHVRPITPGTLALFDRRLNDEWRTAGGANTPLAHYTGVDFGIVEVRTRLCDSYFQRLQRGEITEAEVRDALLTGYNVANAYEVALEARKP